MIKTLADYYKACGVNKPPEQSKALTLYCDPGFPGTPKPPLPSQVTGLHKAIYYNRYGIYDEPGCGKTVILQAWALFYIFQGNKAVILMPPISIPQFTESLEKTFRGQKDFSVADLSCSKAKREAMIEKWDEQGAWPDILLMSYQMFYKLVGQLTEKGYCVLGCDEAHYLRNQGSGITRKVQTFIGDDDVNAGALLLATGTPAFCTLLDTYSLIKLSSPGMYSSLRAFKKAHCVYKEYIDPDTDTARTVLVKFKNKARLYRGLYERGRRMRKDQVFTHKGITIAEVPIQLSPAHKALYKKLVKERFLDLGDKVIEATNQQSLRQKCLQIATVPDMFVPAGTKPPHNTVFEWLEETLQNWGAGNGTKVIVFMHFHNSVDFAKNRLVKYNPAVITGASGNKEKEKQKFMNDPSCTVLIANAQSAGVALNLQGVCRYAIFLEPTGVPGLFTQASERIFRMGQEHHVTILIARLLGTISPRLIRSMRNRAQDVVDVVGDKKTLLNELLGS